VEFPFVHTPEVVAALERAEAFAEGGAVTELHLWLGALGTVEGAALLDSWEVDSDAVRRTVPRVEGTGRTPEADRGLTMASRFTVLTDPDHECVEQLLHGLLIDRECHTFSYLREQGVDPGPAALTLQERMRAGQALSYFDGDAVQLLGLKEGRLGLEERDYVRVAFAVPGLATTLIRELGVDPERLREAAAHWPNSEFHPSSRVHVGRVEPFHLLLALARAEQVVSLMRPLGVVATRLNRSVECLRDDYHRPEEVGYPQADSIKPACEEARPLGAAQVMPEHLLLGLLADVTNSASRALALAGFDLQELRREASAAVGPGVSVKDMDFHPDARLVLAQAVEDWGGKEPDSVFILKPLVDYCSLLQVRRSELKPAIQRVLEGCLPVGQSLTMNGLALGMSREEALAARGQPLARATEDDRESWGYEDVYATFSEGRVRALHGTLLESGGDVMLRKSDSWFRTEEVLGARRRSPAARDSAVMAMTSGGRVRFLMLHDLPAEGMGTPPGGVEAV